jgi:hypothetical protein
MYYIGHNGVENEFKDIYMDDLYKIKLGKRNGL